jgi:hypothetical protein
VEGSLAGVLGFWCSFGDALDSSTYTKGSLAVMNNLNLISIPSLLFLTYCSSHSAQTKPEEPCNASKYGMLPEVCSKDFNVAHALQPILVSFEMDTDHFPSDLAMRLALRNCVLASGMGSDPEI